MYSKSIVFSSVLLALVCMTYATWSDCGSVDGVISTVTISKCSPTLKRCILKRNTNASMVIEFKTNVDSDKITAIVHGVIMGVPMPFNLPNPDGCKDSGITCPIKTGTSYKYLTSIPILGSYPRVTVDIKWQLQNAEGKDIVCALIPAKLT